MEEIIMNKFKELSNLKLKKVSGGSFVGTTIGKIIGHSITHYGNMVSQQHLHKSPING
uniref:Sakacin D98a n=2 Tax=Latilactobacillus sakei TaxID=1599 RepID=U6BYF5_LATSK|nr:sakacin D98a [Latilactobacillus sakei]